MAKRPTEQSGLIATGTVSPATRFVKLSNEMSSRQK